MAFNDGVKSAPIAYIGLVSVIVTLIVVLLLQVVFFSERDAMLAADQASQGPPTALANLTAKQLTVLTRRELVDRERGVVRIGISRAMELVVKELSEGKLPAEVAGPPLPSASPAAPTAPAAGELQVPAGGEKQIPTGAQPATDGAVTEPPLVEPAPAQEKK
ncbi:MAG: hypothetical protein ACYC3X_28330 [Pirellulaceae bacterium]